MTQNTCVASANIGFLLGETKLIKFKATYPEQPDFKIHEANYEIYRNREEIEKGSMDIDDHEISILYTPSKRGIFDLYIELKIADTVRRKHFRISVD